MTNFSIARYAPVMTYHGNSVSNPARAYSVDLSSFAKAKKQGGKARHPKTMLLADTAKALQKVASGKSRGKTIIRICKDQFTVI